MATSLHVAKMFYASGMFPPALEGVGMEGGDSYDEALLYYGYAGEPVPFNQVQYEAEEAIIDDAHNKYLASLQEFYNNFETDTAIGIYAQEDYEQSKEFVIRKRLGNEFRAFQSVLTFGDNFTREGKFNSSTLNPADFEFIDASDITTLLDDANIGDYESFLRFGKYYIAQFLGHTQEEIDIDFQHAINIQYPKDWTDELHSYAIPQNSIFDDTDTLISLSTPNIFPHNPLWFPPSPLENLSGGKYVSQRRGVYGITIFLLIGDVENSPYLRRVSVIGEINGQKIVIRSSIYLKDENDGLKETLYLDMPLDRGDEVGLYLRVENVENGNPSPTDMETLGGYISFKRVK